MRYCDYSANEQRLQIAANGYEQMVRTDSCTVREAIEMNDIASDAYSSSDPAKSALRFAVFLKAAKMAYLEPRHILAWLARSYAGAKAIRDFARNEYEMDDVISSRRAA